MLARAQDRLPGTQQGSFRAPASVRIDGSLADWKDTMKAYNKSTRLYYLVANDDKYLYLAIRATDVTNKAKIAAGGITFTINTSGKKKDKDAFALTYPVIQRQQGRGGRGTRGGGSFGTDSASRQQLISAAKEIKVSGFKDVDDTLISIYNEYSIKAAIGFDSDGNYCYELAVPLKMLGLNADEAPQIGYNLKVNGLQVATRAINVDNLGSADGGGDFGGGGGFRGGGGGGRGGGGGGSRSGRGNSNIDMQDLTSPTDFWAIYTLAKK